MREYVVVNAQLIDLQDLSPQLGKFALNSERGQATDTRFLEGLAL